MVKRIFVVMLLIVVGGGVNVYGSGKLFKQILTGKGSDYSLQSGDTVIKIEFSDKGILLKQLSDSNGGWNWAGEGAPITLLQECQIENEGRQLKWKLVSVDDKSDGKTRTVTTTYSDEDTKVKLRSVWVVHPGAGPVEHTVEVINEGKKAIGIGY